MARTKTAACSECSAPIWTGSTRCAPCSRQKPDPELAVLRGARGVEASRAYRAAHQVTYLKRCRCCDGVYTSTRRSQHAFCSDDCSDSWRIVTAKARAVRRPQPRLVQPCGTDAAYQRGCRCDGCRGAHSELQRKAVARRRPSALAHGHKRRARKRGTQVEHIRPAEIYERDGWRCHICRRKVRRTGKRRDPQGPSLDHVIPLSKGGTHTRDNVACAHLLCNMIKNDSTANVQPLLVG